MGIFKRTLSLESREGGEFTPEVEVDEVIEATSDNDEVNEVAAEIQADVASVEEAEDVIEELNEQVEENEEALETPEAVEAVDVAVSQEALNYATKRLGTTMQEVGLGVISRESAKDDSVTALRLSTEGIKEFVNTVIEQIKRLMRNVANAFKKLYVKALTVFNNTEKAAKKLSEKIKNYEDSKKAGYSDDEKAWFASRAANIAIINGFSRAGIETFIAKNNSPKEVTDAISTLENSVAAAIAAGEEQINSEAFKGLHTVAKGEDAFLTLTDGGKKSVSYFVENFADPKKASIKKETKDADDAENKITSVLKVADVDGILKKLIANGNKKYYEVVKKHIDKLDQEATKSYKSISDAATWSTEARSRRIREISKGLSTATSICLDAIIYNLRGNKNVLNIASKALSFHEIKVTK